MPLLAATIEFEVSYDAGGRRRVHDPINATVHAVTWLGRKLTDPDHDTRLQTLCGQWTRTIYPMSFPGAADANACHGCVRYNESGTRWQPRYGNTLDTPMPQARPAVCEGGQEHGREFDAPWVDGKPGLLTKVGTRTYRLRPGQQHPGPGGRWVYVPD